MKIVYCKYLPPKGFVAMVLFGVVVSRRELTAIEQNHEAIHIRQGNEMLWVFFYLWYVIEWLVRLVQYRNSDKAYRSISFEREAYENQGKKEYLEERRRWGFRKYMKL